MRPPHRLAATVAAIAVVLTACGGGGDPDDGPTATPTAAPTSSPTSEATTGTGSNPGSSITTDPGEDIRSEVEVRVGEIISEYEGIETGEGTQLSVDADVLFAFDQATLLPEAEARLDDIVEVLEFYDGAPVEIVGHTDSDGAAEYNQRLSERRAQAVATYLTDAGVDASRFTVEGRGESDPVAPNDSDANKQRNRRVEILVVGVAPPDAD
ncbi:OmpA family protein [Nitriliruptor alkaliphilus]|uniref:OmpA family protein n=1 Tax=Nitriliruptor alkaliphilus TaxID=427918 RepID=UPI0006969DFC|nr:OmpA family protein [Nitriliruptor alkaliphilus]